MRETHEIRIAGRPIRVIIAEDHRLHKGGAPHYLVACIPAAAFQGLSAGFIPEGLQLELELDFAGSAQTVRDIRRDYLAAQVHHRANRSEKGPKWKTCRGAFWNRLLAWKELLGSPRAVSRAFLWTGGRPGRSGVSTRHHARTRWSETTGPPCGLHHLGSAASAAGIPDPRTAGPGTAKADR